MSDYTFFLHFKNDNVTMEIEEPFLFNAFSHSMERKRDGFAIDVCLFAENTSLLFTNSTYSSSEDYEDIDGTVMFNLSHGLKRIIDSYKEYGPDGEIELTINYLGLQLTKCDFDLEDIDSDLVSYFKCGFIENNIRSKHKIREDDVMIDVYAETDLDGRLIEKLVPIKVLIPSKTINATSKWAKVDIPYFNVGAPNNVSKKLAAGSAYDRFNFCKLVVDDGIENTESPSPLEFSNEYSDTYDGTMKMVNCKTSKKGVKFTIKSDIKFVHIYNGRTGYANKSSLSLTLVISTGVGIYDNIEYVLYSQELFGTTTQISVVPEVIDFELPTILNEGEFVSMYWTYTWDSGTVNMSIEYSQIDNGSHIEFNDCTIEMSAMETVINSVIQGVRWIDLLKKSSEIISGLPVDAPRIDIGGEYYDTIISNGGGVRNISNIPFNIKVKDAFEIGKMVAHDYQITEDKILVGEYKDYFSGKLIRTFDVKPDEKFLWNTNKDYRIKTFNYKFRNFEQDRQEQRTLDAVHTEEQILMPNTKTITPKKIEINQILDVYKIDSLRRLGIDPETKESSLIDDTDLVMIKVMQIDANHKEKYVGLLNVSASSIEVKIYSSTFRWDKIGLGLTSSFAILSGSNIGTYQITKIESTILTLTKLTGNDNISENKVIEIEYSIEGVSFIAETDQKFSEVLGVASKDTYINLFYSKFRNIQKWLPYLATCSMRFLDSNLKVSFLKSNQDLSTRLLTETTSLVEKNDIKVSDIAELKCITDRIFSVNIYLNNPGDVIEIFNELNVRNTDGTIGGYYGFKDSSGEEIYGYPEKLDYIPLENKIEATCSEKYELGNGIIDLLNSDVKLYSQYFASGVYITLYMEDGSIFVMEKRFTKIKINGVLYSDLQLFLNDLEIYFS